MYIHTYKYIHAAYTYQVLGVGPQLLLHLWGEGLWALDRASQILNEVEVLFRVHAQYRAAICPIITRVRVRKATQ